MKVIQGTLLLALLTLITLITVGCGKQDKLYGDSSITGETVSLATLLETPDQFNQKEVTLTGVVDGQCGNRCDFTFREDNNAIKIYMGDIEAPIISKGSPITVTAKVLNGDAKLILTAASFTLNEGGE